MKIRLYVVNGSHPCATVEKALALKGLPYKVTEWPPPSHVLFQRVIFGGRTVPGITIDGEKVQGSRAILRRLDELVPDPPLVPRDEPARSAVLEAEAWGDEILQPIGRRLIWPAMKRDPKSGPSYSAGSKLPLPASVLRASIPLIARMEIAINKASEDAAQADLRALPGHLDRIDAWIADGTMGADAPNAADLQIAPTLALLMTLGDVRPLIENRPCGALARRLFPDTAGSIPAGTLPASWIPQPA